MPLNNKIKNCPKKIVVEPIQIPEPILTVQATPAPVPRAKRGRPRKNQPDPPEPTTSDPPASFPVPVAKKARKPRAKKINSELLEQVPVQKAQGKGKAKQKVQVEFEVEPVITVKKPKKSRLTKSQKLAQELQEEASEASEDASASGSEESEEIDSDEELDRAIDRLAKIKALQSD